MIRLATIAVVLTLAGCATRPVPVTPDPVRLPALPESLGRKAEPLPPITATDTHGLIREGLATDRAYADVRHQLNSLIDFYGCVRDAVQAGTDGAKCFGEGR